MSANALTASADLAEATLTADPTAEVTASAESRTITGLVLPWRTPGRTSRGQVRVDNPDAIAIPAQGHRVKLLHGHRNEGGRAVGHLVAHRATDAGLEMTFQLGSGAHADAALASAAEHIDDGLSVEMVGVQTARGVLTAGRLDAVALVPVPAFDDARVGLVTAAADDEADPEADPEDAPDDDDEDDTEDQADDEAADTAESVDTPPDTDTTDNSKDPDMTASHRSGRLDESARVPASLGTGTPAATGTLTASARSVAEILGTARTGGTLDDEMTAALVDITHTPMLDAVQPGWLGRVWGEQPYEREYTAYVTARALTSFKMTGWRVTERPGVDWWDGDKTEIPSFPMAVEPVDFTAKKIAGGNDIAREWVDFGQDDLIAEYWRSMAESYAILTDEYIPAQIVAAANALPEAPNLITAVVRAGRFLKNARQRASYVLMNPADEERLLDITNDNVPAWLDRFGAIARPESWNSHELVPEGSVIVGDPSAMEFYELAGSPIRANAVNIAQGGYDYALFGYAECFHRNPRGIVSVPVTDFAGTPGDGGTEPEV